MKRIPYNTKKACNKKLISNFYEKMLYKHQICINLRCMRFDSIIGLMKYMIICLAFICFDKADDSSSALRLEDEISSEFTIPAQDYFQTENFSFSVPETQCRVPRQSNFINTFRTFSQAQRTNSVNQSRNGFTLVKAGKSMNEYTTSLFFKSIINFPSGLNESSHHLIGLGKLII